MPRYRQLLQRQEVEHDSKPAWLRAKYPSGPRFEAIRSTLGNLRLHTVCEEANCPNIAECWGGGTATFMVMGDVCTRGCRFCMVKSGNPNRILDLHEPFRVARAIAELGLTYAVITSVDRDDLDDGGAAHLAAVIRAVKEHSQEVIVEILIPDFQGDLNHLRMVMDAGPEVVAHNLETTESLTPHVRDPRASYQQSLKILKGVKEINPSTYSKSSLMLGLGEEEEELVSSMRDLRSANVDILTLGQYLRPSRGHIPVAEYVPPERFSYYKRIAEEIGFLYVAAGPFVRSSYRAGEFFLEALLRKRKHEQS